MTPEGCPKLAQGEQPWVYIPNEPIKGPDCTPYYTKSCLPNFNNPYYLEAHPPYTGNPNNLPLSILNGPC